MRRVYTKALLPQDEVAAILPLSALVLVATIILCGLAIDGGRLFLTQLRLQRALDAGVTTGVYLLPTRDSSSVEEYTKRQIESNLVEIGIDLASVSPINPIADSFHVEASASVTVPLVLMSVLPGFDLSVVAASASAARPKLYIGLVLDTSGSMGSDGKIEALKEAVTGFVQLLNEDKDDRIGIVTYSAPSQITPISLLQEDLDIAQILIDIEGFSPQTTTCVGCGLAHMIQQFDDAGVSGPVDPSNPIIRFIILMTDGMPNKVAAGRTTCGWSFNPDDYAVAPYTLYNYGAFLQSIAMANAIKARGVTLYTVGLGTVTNFGTPQCERNEWAEDITSQPGPIFQDGFWCYWCTEPNTWHHSPEVYPDDSDDEDEFQWCGGNVTPHLLSEMANDPENFIPALQYPVEDSFVLPDEDDCDPIIYDPTYNDDCYCRSALGPDYPQGITLIAPSGAELDDAFLAIFQLAINATRLVE